MAGSSAGRALGDSLANRMRGTPSRGVDDLLDGVSRLGGESPEVIRLTFKALHDVIKAQGEAIKALERGLEQRPTKAEAASLVDGRPTAADLARALASLTSAMDEHARTEKAGRDELDRRLQALSASAVSREQLGAELDAKLKPLAQMQATLGQGVCSRAELQAVADEAERRLLALDERLAAAVDGLTAALEQKAGIREVAAELEAKASVADVNAVLDSKATVADVNESLLLKANKGAVVAALQLKVSHAELADALARADEASGAAHAQQLAAIAAEQAELRRRLSELPSAAELRRALAAKADASQLREALGAASAREGERAALDAAREELRGRQAEQRQAREELGALRRAVEEGRADTRALAEQLERKLDASRAARWVALLGDGGGDSGGDGRGLSLLGGGGGGGSLGSSVLGGSLLGSLGGAGSIGDVRPGGALARLLEGKAERGEVREGLAGKADARALHEMARQVEAQLGSLAEALRAEVRALAAGKADAARLDAIAAQLAGKADAARMEALLEGKASVEEVNRSLLEVSAALGKRAPSDALTASAAEQALILESLCSEHLLGRWIWKTGRTRQPSSLVPWNAQNINTNPENFVWEKDRGHITCMAGGLYEISFGFYSARKPAVQLLVNGEPVISAINSAAYAVHHSSGRLASVGPHPAGNVTGLTLIDFLALPPRARVAISYKGEEGAEGFLGLKKL